MAKEEVVNPRADDNKLILLGIAVGSVFYAFIFVVLWGFGIIQTNGSRHFIQHESILGDKPPNGTVPPDPPGSQP